MNNVLDFKEEKTEIELLGKLNNVLTLLDDIDKAIEELPQRQSNIELLRSDLEHLLEDKEMGSVGYKNIAKELEKVRKQRRHLKKAWEIVKCYQNNRNKLTYKEQRPFVRQALETCYADLQTSYNYRLLNAQNIRELLGNDSYNKHTTKQQDIVPVEETITSRGVVVKRADLIEQIEKGLTNKEIGDLYGVTPSGITRLKERLGIPKETRGNKRPKNVDVTEYTERKIKPREVTLEMYNDLHNKGFSDRQMAKVLGVSTSSMILIKRRLGLV